MSLSSEFMLIHRDKVSDAEMKRYRGSTAPKWFLGDPMAQAEYVNLPGQAPAYATQNNCLTHKGEVKGTISIYSFKHLHSSLFLENGQTCDTTQFPDWLTCVGYIGDNSVTPDIENQGIMTELINTMMKQFPHAYLIGITSKKNNGMRQVFLKTGAIINEQPSPVFYQPRSPRSIPTNTSGSKITHTPLFAHIDYPPVAHLFHNKDYELICAAVGTTPNNPNRHNSSLSPQNTELLPNQIVGFINPNTRLSPRVLDEIYRQISAYKYISLFQLGNSTLTASKRMESGYKRGSVTALYTT